MSLQLRLRLLEEASRDPTIYELMILILSIIIVEAYFFSPGISFYLYFKGKLKSEYLPSFTIFFNLVNCILWVILGHPDHYPPFTISPSAPWTVTHP